MKQQIQTNSPDIKKFHEWSFITSVLTHNNGKLPIFEISNKKRKRRRDMVLAPSNTDKGKTCNITRLQNLAASLLLLGRSWYRSLAITRVVNIGTGGRLLVSLVVGDNCENGALENLVDTSHFFAAAFHVLSTHLLGDGHALFRRDWRQALGLEHVNTCSLVAQIRLETDKNKRRVRAKV